MKIKNPVTEVGGKRQAEMSKKEKKVNEVAGKTSWNPQNHQNSQPRQEKDKLEL